MSSPVPSGQEERERAFRELFEELTRGAEEYAKEMDVNTENQRKAHFRVLIAPLHMMFIKPLIQEFFDAGVELGLELRGCCEHKEPHA